MTQKSSITHHKVVTMVQARMESTRLPGKVLKDIVGKPMLWHIADRLKHARLVDQTIIATVDGENNKPIIKFAQENGIDYYAGSEFDLLDRIYQAAKRFSADAVVRITADCPLVDPVVVDGVIKYYLDSGRFDYVSNARPKATYPIGLDAEIYSFKALEGAWKEVEDPFRRGWLSTNFFEHPEKYRLGLVEYEEDLSYMRWTVDYPDDLDFVTEIYKRLYREHRIFLMKDILDLLKKEPELIEINKHHERDKGYFEALKKAGKL